jgi:hypothetical protein
MSNHAARPGQKKLRRAQIGWNIFGVIFFVVAVVFPLLVAHPWTKDERVNWPSVTGQVLETRIVVANQTEHQYQPGEVDYRVEARVTYERDGIQHNTWLPASKPVNDKGFLEFWLLQKKSKTCTVCWVPKNPSYVEAVLY